MVACLLCCFYLFICLFCKSAFLDISSCCTCKMQKRPLTIKIRRNPGQRKHVCSYILPSGTSHGSNLTVIKK